MPGYGGRYHMMLTIPGHYDGCPFCLKSIKRRGLVRHCISCRWAFPFTTATGLVETPNVYQQLQQHIEPCLDWLRRLPHDTQGLEILKIKFDEAMERAESSGAVNVLQCDAVVDVGGLQKLVKLHEGAWRDNGLMVLQAACLRNLAPVIPPRWHVGLVAMQMYGQSPLCSASMLQLGSLAQFEALTADLDAAVIDAFQSLSKAFPSLKFSASFPCFVEALVASAPPNTIRTLYAPAMELQELDRRTLTAATDVPAVSTTQDPEIVNDRDPEERYPWAATNISAADVGLLGVCQRVMPGISTGVGIRSATFTSALLHPEDNGLVSVNILILGASKIWYVVPPGRLNDFIAIMTELLGPIDGSAAAALCCCKMASPVLTAEQMLRAGVRRFVQEPGDMVVTAPVSPVLPMPLFAKNACVLPK